MLKSIVSIETIQDDEKNNTYIVTKYNDNTMRIKIYQKKSVTSAPKYIKTILGNSTPSLHLNF